MDAQSDRIYRQFDKVDQQFKGIGTQIGEFRAELNDVKVWVAPPAGPIND